MDEFNRLDPFEEKISELEHRSEESKQRQKKKRKNRRD